MQSTQCTPPINMENNFNFIFLKTVGYVLRYFRVGSLFPRDLFSKTTTFYQNGGAHRHVVRLIGHPVDFLGNLQLAERN